MTARTLKQVSDELGVPYITLTQWIKSGEFQPPARLYGVKGPYIFADDDMDRLRRFMRTRHYEPGKNNQGRPPKSERANLTPQPK